jgi:hypothetical protein
MRAGIGEEWEIWKVVVHQIVGLKTKQAVQEVIDQQKQVNQKVS